MAFRLQKQIIQIFVFHNFIDVSVDFVPEFFLSGKEKIIFSRLSSFSWVLVVFRPDLVKDLEFKSNLRTSLTRFFPMFPSDPLEKIKVLEGSNTSMYPLTGKVWTLVMFYAIGWCRSTEDAKLIIFLWKNEP